MHGQQRWSDDGQSMVKPRFSEACPWLAGVAGVPARAWSPWKLERRSPGWTEHSQRAASQKRGRALPACHLEAYPDQRRIGGRAAGVGASSPLQDSQKSAVQTHRGWHAPLLKAQLRTKMITAIRTCRWSSSTSTLPNCRVTMSARSPLLQRLIAANNGSNNGQQQRRAFLCIPPRSSLRP